MEQKHANELRQWTNIEQEEKQVQEEVALEGRQPRKQLQDNVVSNVKLVSSSSSSSLTVNGGTEHANDVSSLNFAPEELLLQKDEQVEKMGEITGDDNSNFHEEKADHADVGLGLVAEFSEASSNGEAIISNDTAASQSQNSVYFDEQDGSEANNVSHEVQNGDGARSVLPTYNRIGEFNIQVDNPNIKKSACNGVNNQDVKTVEDRHLFNSKLSPLHASSEIKTTDAKDFDGESSTKQDPEIIEEIDQELEDFDVESVLAKQETHDLICPICNSCITKRVILKKRKRTPRNLESKSKRDKLDTAVSSESVGSSAHETNQGDHANLASDAGHLQQQPLLVNDPDPVEEQSVFRCLECFSIFIPRGNCFNLFWKSTSARELETSQITSTIPASDTKSSSNITMHESSQITSTVPASDMKRSSNITMEESSRIISTIPASDTKSSSNITMHESSTMPASDTNSFSNKTMHETSQTTSNIPASDTKGSSNTTISNVQNSLSVADSKGNWFLSLFTSNKGKTSNEQGKASSKISKTGPAEQEQSSSIASNVINSPENGKASSKNSKTGLAEQKQSSLIASNVINSLENGNLGSPVTGRSTIDNGKAVPDFKPGHGGPNGNLVINVGEEKNGSSDMKNTGRSEANAVANLPSKDLSSNIVPKQERDLSASAITSNALTNPGEPAKYGTLKPGKGEPYFLVQPDVGSRMPEKSLKDINKTPEDFQNGYSSLVMQVQVANDPATGMQISGVNAKISSWEDFNPEKMVEKNTGGEKKPGVRDRGDVIVDVEDDKIKLSASHIGVTDPNNASILGTATQVHVGERSRAEIGETRGWEILKSIVYGGLIESITSLGIVSSAVGSGAAPLNIIALGLANLIGGLFVIGHNLLELKDDKSGEGLQQTNTQEDRYQEQLGRRENFMLHAVVAILSFLIFGSVPIIIYGILIRKNFPTELKLAAVAATSLLCIILLAIGKVYTKRPPKSYFTTVFYYVTMSLAASGVSYIVGGLIKDFLEKLSNSESGFVITLPLSDQGTMDAAWRSY